MFLTSRLSALSILTVAAEAVEKRRNRHTSKKHRRLEVIFSPVNKGGLRGDLLL